MLLRDCYLFCAVVLARLAVIHSVCPVLVSPASVCGDTVANTFLCNSLTALRHCTSATYSVVTNVTNCCSAGENVQLVVFSSNVTRVLSEQVDTSATIIASSVVQLTQQLNWSRVTVLADSADYYFLRAAEQIYKMVEKKEEFNFIQFDVARSGFEDTIDRIERLNLRIVIVSLRPAVALELLCRAHERNLKWPEYVWIVHGLNVSSDNNVCSNMSLEGIITVQIELPEGSADNVECDQCCADCPLLLESCLLLLESCSLLLELCPLLLESCSLLPMISSSDVVILQQAERQSVILARHDETGVLEPINFTGPVPSDLPPQSQATVVYVVVFYAGISFCFFCTTITLILYVYFRNEPAVKATSVSLSGTIFIGCYLLVFYLLVLNSTLLPSYPRLSNAVRNFICVFRSWTHGVGYPVALILSTLLVKLLRVYRIFNHHGKISKYSSSNLALLVYVLLLTSPNALICLIWTAVDPYRSVVSSAVVDGLLVVREQCVCDYNIQWLSALFVYVIIMCLLLIVFAVLTRKVKYRNFKDTKKVSVLCFVVVFTCASLLFYWYLLRIIKANSILIHGTLQFGHYCIILECLGFIFAPKLFPILRDLVRRRLSMSFISTNVPTVSEGTMTTDYMVISK